MWPGNGVPLFAPSRTRRSRTSSVVGLVRDLGLQIATAQRSDVDDVGRGERDLDEEAVTCYFIRYVNYHS